MKKAALVSLFSVVALLSQLRSQGWVDVTPASPAVPNMATREISTACYDPVRQVTWLFVQNQTFSWDGTTLGGPFPATLGRTPWDSVWDSVNQRVLVLRRVSGQDHELIGWDGISEIPLPATGLPSDTSMHYSRMAFDESSGLLLVAHRGVAASSLSYTRTFDGTTWTALSPPVMPVLGNSSLAAPSMFFDDSRNRVTLITNFLSGGVLYPQYWEWTGSNWAQRYPAQLPQVPGMVAPAQPRGFSAALKFDFTQPQPRMFSIADGEFGELFLTNWPATRDDHQLVYDSVRDRFVMIGGRDQLIGTAFRDIWELDLGTTASFTTYGAGCQGSGGVPTIAAQGGSVPSVNTAFSIQVANLPWTGPCFMWLGFSNQSYGGLPLPVNLAILNAPQCDVLMSPDILFSIPNVLGTSVWTIALPNVPGFTFYNQAIAFDAAANPLGLVFSNASEAVVGQ